MEFWSSRLLEHIKLQAHAPKLCASILCVPNLWVKFYWRKDSSVFRYSPLKVPQKSVRNFREKRFILRPVLNVKQGNVFSFSSVFMLMSTHFNRPNTLLMSAHISCISWYIRATYKT
uniref:Uncharacterized protein n=1 Tax=Cacopsylla melanoneura TaxID=428564 RepID=A0A8D9E6F2_9HEMI